MSRTANRRQQTSARSRDNAPLQIRLPTNERETAPAPGASVPTNVSVDHQTLMTLSLTWEQHQRFI